MADVSSKDIAEYSQYLLAQGQKPEDVKAYADYLHSAHDIKPEPMSALRAAVIKSEEGALLGLRPVAAGLGAGMGAASVPLQNASGLLNTVRAVPSALSNFESSFKEGRAEANQEQNKAQKDQPGVSTVANIGGSLLSLPLLPAKGLAGAVRLGAGLGAAQAAGSANSLGEAAVDTIGGGALGAAGYGAGKAIGKGAEMLADTTAAKYVIDKAGALAGKAKEIGKKILVGTPSELTGVPDKEIEAYATRADKVKKIIQDSQAEGKFDSQLAANHMKDNIANDVKRTKAVLNGHITDALNQVSDEKVVPSQSITGALQEAADRLDPVYDKDQIKKIIDQIDLVNSKAGKSGMLSVQDLQATKNHLYEVAEGAYNENSQFFQIGSDVANAAKSAGAVAKKVIDKVGPPEIVNANRQLSQLHDIQDSMSRSLLDSKASATSLYSVGAGSNPKDTLALRELGGVTGTDYLKGATDLSAARTFSSPPLFNKINTGRSAFGAITGGALGGTVGGIVGGVPGAFIGGKVGGSIGTIVSSPAALKLAIDTGQLSGRAIKAVSQKLGLSSQNLGAIFEALQTPQAQEILIRAMSSENQAAADDSNLSALQRRMIEVGQRPAK